MNKEAESIRKTHINKCFCLKNSEYKSRESSMLYLCA